MCANCGVDPLASNKGFWAELLGFGDFYYELGVQIVEACLSTRGENGGLCEIDHLMEAVTRRRGSAAAPVSEDDILRAIDRLKVLGGGWTVHQIAGRKIVRSVPVELNSDQSEVIRLAAAAAAATGGGSSAERGAAAAASGGSGGGGVGYVTVSGVERASGWRKERVIGALQELLKCGMAMIDDGDPTGGERLYWLPCVSFSAARGGDDAAVAA